MTSRTQKLRAACMAAAAALAIAAAPLAAKEAAPTAFDPVAHSRVVEVSKQLRCLVCQNESIADSQAELAIDLRNQVIAQVRAGKTNEEIVQYMVDRYGDFVLYNPPFKTSTLILWLGPAALFLGGIAAFASRYCRIIGVRFSSIRQVPFCYSFTYLPVPVTASMRPM